MCENTQQQLVKTMTTISQHQVLSVADNGSLQFHAEAFAALKQQSIAVDGADSTAPKPICVIMGAQGIGKTATTRQLAQLHGFAPDASFAVGHACSHETRGIQATTYNNTVFFDTEGLGAITDSNSHDFALLRISAAVSSVFVLVCNKPDRGVLQTSEILSTFTGLYGVRRSHIIIACITNSTIDDTARSTMLASLNRSFATAAIVALPMVQREDVEECIANRPESVRAKALRAAISSQLWPSMDAALTLSRANGDVMTLDHVAEVMRTVCTLGRDFRIESLLDVFLNGLVSDKLAAKKKDLEVSLRTLLLNHTLVHAPTQFIAATDNMLSKQHNVPMVEFIDRIAPLIVGNDERASLRCTLRARVDGASAALRAAILHECQALRTTHDGVLHAAHQSAMASVQNICDWKSTANLLECQRQLRQFERIPDGFDTAVAAITAHPRVAQTRLTISESVRSALTNAWVRSNQQHLVDNRALANQSGTVIRKTYQCNTRVGKSNGTHLCAAIPFAVLDRNLFGAHAGPLEHNYHTIGVSVNYLSIGVHPPHNAPVALVLNINAPEQSVFTWKTGHSRRHGCELVWNPATATLKCYSKCGGYGSGGRHTKHGVVNITVTALPRRARIGAPFDPTGLLDQWAPPGTTPQRAPARAPAAPATPQTLNRGSQLVTTATGPAVLAQGQFLQSQNGKHRLIMQGDGNCVLYSEGKAVWSTATHNCGVAPFCLVVRRTGNMQVCGAFAETWSSGTPSKDWQKLGPFRLVLQNDRNLVLYRANGHVQWSTYTQVKEKK